MMPNAPRIQSLASDQRRVVSFQPAQPSGLLDFPLIAPVNTATSLGKARYGKSVYFGTGIVTPKAISQGLPLDFFGMLLTAEWSRRAYAGDEIIHEISDVHALADNRHNPGLVMTEARRQQALATQLAAGLGMGDYYRCVLASEYRNTQLFDRLQAEVDGLCAADVPVYMRYQSAGNLYFARHENVGCKIGWLVEDTGQPKGLDERAFNAAYDRLGLDPLAFIYTWCGWNFDASRNRVSPYTSIAGERRLMLASNTPVLDELTALQIACAHPKASQSVLLHLARLASAYDRLYPTGLPSFTVDRRVMAKDPVIDSGGSVIHIPMLARYLEMMRAAKDRQIDSLLETAPDYRAERVQA